MKKRNPLNKGHAVPIFIDRFGTEIKKLKVRIEETRNLQHRGGKGDEREDSIANLIGGLLPNVYKAIKGEVVDLGKRTSPQLDVMIYDSSRNFPFYSGATAVLPAEALLASIEVKSLLNDEEIKKSQIAAAKLRSLRPFKKQQAKSGMVGIDGDARYFHTLFAYDVAWGDNWPATVCDKIAEHSVGDYEGVEMVYVLGKGLVHPSRRRFLPERDETAQALTAYWVSTFNFVARENPRRGAVPYFSYAADLGKMWKKV
ncbi:hypothetical protein C8J30_10941 [Rhodobacter viridis]|uniref:DUF6602 domain-containing protein n=1 Tax=Rhodobacter viridis TaxID=1054202 RepID=A0A318U4N1_9RHOB|nr:DUF6602 domain-containing protein [Rhodobacter viridis]PYF09295.1 hypothetical protein C8J30_10941 [Rhodobacter viridis]